MVNRSTIYQSAIWFRGLNSGLSLSQVMYHWAVTSWSTSGLIHGDSGMHENNWENRNELGGKRQLVKEAEESEQVRDYFFVIPFEGLHLYFFPQD